MEAAPDPRALGAAGMWDELEEAWLERVETARQDLRFFREALQALLRGGQEPRAVPLVQILLESYAERPDGAALFAFARTALGLWPQSALLRPALFGALRQVYADRPSLERLEQHFRVAEAADPSAALERLETWLRFDVGRAVLLAGRGVGRVVEIHPGLGSLRVDFPGAPRMTLKLAEAEKLLRALEPGHFLLDKLERPAELQALAEADPGAVLERVFASLDRPLGLGELREALSGIVPEDRWAAWWKRAAADPRLAASGGKRPTYRWSATGEAADAALREAFAAAPPRERLDLARKHAGRSAAVAAFMGAGLASVAREARDSDPSLTLEVLLTLEKTAATAEAGLTPGELLAVEDPVPVVAGVEDRSTRERALLLLRERRSDWRVLYARLLRAETDTRTLALLYDALRDGDGAEALARTVDDVLARPHTSPRLFVWLCRELRRRPELDPRGDWGLLRRLLDTLTLEAFRGLRAPLRELFDAGGLGEHLAARLDHDQAEQLHAVLTRDLGLEEHRKDLMRHVILARHPELRETEEEVLYTTAAGLERKRAEFERLTRVEIPHNAEEIRKAAAHGDLRENFEYKAAREKHEMLSSRAKTLHDELRRARALEPAAIDPSCIRVGTTVVLEPVGGGAPRTLTILGPWDSDPAQGVVSYLAPAVEPLLGCEPGATVRFGDASYRIAGIEVWRS